MRPKNPLLRFHHAAESAGYPALLIASVVCLGLVVAPVGLLALTRSAWVLALALLSLIGAVALLAGVIAASFADYDEPARRRGDAVGGEPEEVASTRRVDDRRAA
jgi:hypothetical protein